MNIIKSSVMRVRAEESIVLGKNDGESSLSHTSWNCQYRIVFTAKYRRKVIYRKLCRDTSVYPRRLCDYKGVEIVEANVSSDHIYILVNIIPKISVSSFMGYLKGKSILMIFEEHSNLKYNYGNDILGRRILCKSSRN